MPSPGCSRENPASQRPTWLPSVHPCSMGPSPDLPGLGPRSGLGWDDKPLGSRVAGTSSATSAAPQRVGELASGGGRRGGGCWRGLLGKGEAWRSLGLEKPGGLLRWERCFFAKASQPAVLLSTWGWRTAWKESPTRGHFHPAPGCPQPCPPARPLPGLDQGPLAPPGRMPVQAPSRNRCWQSKGRPGGCKRL